MLIVRGSISDEAYEVLKEGNEASVNNRRLIRILFAREDAIKHEQQPHRK